MIHSFLFFLPSLISLILNETILREYAYLLYFYQALYLTVILYCRGKPLDLMRPCVLALLYVLLSFSLASWAFYHDLVHSLVNLSNYYNWVNYNISTFVVLVFNTLLFVVYINTDDKQPLLELSTLEKKELKIRVSKIFASLSVFTVPFLFFDVDLSLFGGVGGIATIPKVLLAIVAIYYFSLSESKMRFLAYAIIIFSFSIVSYDDKRDAIFLIFPILYLEVLFNITKFSFKLVFYLFLTAIFLLFLIVIMSIARGYGGYEVNSVFEAIPLAFDYVSSDSFLVYLFNNIEVNYTFFHTMQSIEYIVDDFWLVSYGESIIKFLFLVVPRTIMESKPDSFIDMYTTKYDPTFRLLGGSWPPNFYGELFWNFSYLAFFIVLPVFYFFERCYMKIKHAVSVVSYSYSALSLFVVYTYLILIRGSGFDLFLFQCILACFFCFLSYSLLYLMGSLKTPKRI